MCNDLKRVFIIIKLLINYFPAMGIKKYFWIEALSKLLITGI